MKNNYLFLIIILVAGLVIVLGIVFVQKPKKISKEVDFVAPYQLIENFSCNLQGYNSNHGRICLNNITFNYVGKEYSLTSPNFYQTPNCIEAFGSSFCPGSYIWKDEIILENGRIHIIGLYDSRNNLLFNYSISNSFSRPFKT